MTQEIFDIIEIVCLIVGLIINLLTLVFVFVYTNKTYSIAESTRKTVNETTTMAKITAESYDISEKILEEMRKAREAQNAPYVFVYIDHKEEDAVKLYLVIKNAGKGTATNIKIKFEPELQNEGIYSLKHIKKIINNLPPLPPNGEIRHAFILTTHYFKKTPALPRKYDVHISFTDSLRIAEKTVKQVISFDFFQGSRLNEIREKRSN